MYAILVPPFFIFSKRKKNYEENQPKYTKVLASSWKVYNALK